jgi:hypothetical protein
MKKIISATLFFMISVLLTWFTVDAAVITAYGTSAGDQQAHCSETFKPHNPYNRINNILDSTLNFPAGNQAAKGKLEDNDIGNILNDKFILCSFVIHNRGVLCRQYKMEK